MRRDELRKMCAEIIANRNDDQDVRRSGTCIAFAAIIPELLDELERAEAERDRLEAWAVEAEYWKLFEYHEEWNMGVFLHGGTSADMDPGRIREEAEAEIRKIMAGESPDESGDGR